MIIPPPRDMCEIDDLIADTDSSEWNSALRLRRDPLVADFSTWLDRAVFEPQESEVPGVRIQALSPQPQPRSHTIRQFAQ